jgi:50S ribosomal protein L16 3-hydroxylase
LSRGAFVARAGKRGVRLDPRTQLLYDERSLFINGAAQPWPAAGMAALRALANARELPPQKVRALGRESAALLHDWYRHGYLH